MSFSLSLHGHGRKEGSGLGIQSGRAQRTYRCIQHYELQPGAKQRHVKLGDPHPPFSTLCVSEELEYLIMRC